MAQRRRARRSPRWPWLVGLALAFALALGLGFGGTVRWLGGGSGPARDAVSHDSLVPAPALDQPPATAPGAPPPEAAEPRSDGAAPPPLSAPAASPLPSPGAAGAAGAELAADGRASGAAAAKPRPAAPHEHLTDEDRRALDAVIERGAGKSPKNR